MNIRGFSNKGYSSKGSGIEPSRLAPRQELRFASVSGLANWAFKSMPPAPNMSIGGLSLEDWAARSSLLASVYVPQGLLAIWERQGPIETWSRNVMTFIGGIAITMFAKHPTFGFNAVSNKLMLPKENLRPLPSGILGKLSLFWKHPEALWRYPLNAIRPTYNYLEVFKEAGLNLSKVGYSGVETPSAMLKAIQNKTFWTAMDVNQKQKLLNYAPKAELIQSLLKRITACKILSVIGSGILMTILTGIGVQLLVFSVFAPMDKYFTPKSEAKKKKNPDPYPLPPAAAKELRQRVAFAALQQQMQGRANG